MYSKNIYCVNCGEKGHILKECFGPITSFGIICFRWVYSEQQDFLLSNSLQNLVTKKKQSYPIVKFLMIQRKDTIGYIDFIRGKYNPNQQNILVLFNEMTKNEKHKLLNCSFDTIWNDLWINHDNKYFKNEYESSNRKFNNVDIQKYVDMSETNYTYQEFGFPKGRRNIKETNLDCAKREFFEETGYPPNSYTIYDDYIFEEDFIGTNNVHYKHVYYLAKLNDSIASPSIDAKNTIQTGEVQNIGFFSFNECLDLIRPYDIEKKNVLTQVYNYITDARYRYFYTSDYLIELIH